VEACDIIEAVRASIHPSDRDHRPVPAPAAFSPPTTSRTSRLKTGTVIGNVSGQIILEELFANPAVKYDLAKSFEI